MDIGPLSEKKESKMKTLINMFRLFVERKKKLIAPNNR